MRSFDTHIASSCFAQKSASIVLLQINADIDCKRFDSPSHIDVRHDGEGATEGVLSLSSLC